jgi:hypothetical protein
MFKQNDIANLKNILWIRLLRASDTKYLCALCAYVFRFSSELFFLFYFPRNGHFL